MYIFLSATLIFLKTNFSKVYSIDILTKRFKILDITENYITVFYYRKLSLKHNICLFSKQLNYIQTNTNSKKKSFKLLSNDRRFQFWPVFSRLMLYTFVEFHCWVVLILVHASYASSPIKLYLCNLYFVFQKNFF